MEGMSLDAAPLGDMTNSSTITPTKDLSTIRTPKPRLSSQRKATAMTTRKVSTASPTARRVSRKPSVNTPTARRISTQQPKQPLSLDMSFGNSTSTVRQFKRVSSGNQPPSPPQRAGSPQDSVFDSDSENKPPPVQAERRPSVVAANKEAILGRRAFAKCVDPAFQESHAATGDVTKRDALGEVVEAWSALDEIDPEGELILLKAIMDRVQADPKLASVLLPQRVANAQLASLRMSPPKKSMLVSEAEVGSRDMTPRSSPSKPRRTSELPSTPSKPSGSPGKLVLNPHNPHLRKMRTNQQAETDKEKANLEDKMPGKVEPGMEHVGMLADVLYGRWAEGLKVRWPLA
ncbi:hypothetical protein KC331_g13332 [Hortaea werneckii]|nr:hypothetical protein KC331_g13332 [Hortaea werneckii]